MQDFGASKLDSAAIHQLLAGVGAEFDRAGLRAEVAIYRGAALLLLFDNRPNTVDVDYVPVSSGIDSIDDITDRVRSRHGLEPGWFNDAVSMFKSIYPDHQFFGDIPAGRQAGLRVFTASPRYMLAMKMMAMRSSLETSDVFDTWNLIDACGIKTIDEAQTLLRLFYPGEVLPQGHQQTIEQIFADKTAGKPFDAMRY